MDEEGDILSVRTHGPKKIPSFNLSSCFHSHEYHHFTSSASSTSATAPPSPPHFLSPSSWFRSVSRVASPVRKGSGRRRRHSADFSYDPLSYSLNFDHGDDFGIRSPVAAAAARRRLRDVELPPPVRAPLNREGEKDEVVPKTATKREISMTLL